MSLEVVRLSKGLASHRRVTGKASQMPRTKGDSKVLPVTSSAEVRHLVGPVGDDTVLAILKCEASVEDLEVAASYVLGDGSALDRAGHPMVGKVAQLYDILRSDTLYANANEG
jgi:hypothetical protein